MGKASGPFTSFYIRYDKDSAIYRAGDTVTGRLHVNLREAVTLKSISVLFEGRTSYFGCGDHTSSDEQIYFSRDIVLLDRPPGKSPGSFLWNVGSHSLPFECPIPRDCPTSYEGPVAFIRYLCRATVVQTVEQGKDASHVIAVPFTVLEIGSKSPDPELMRPVGASEAVMLKHLCCSQGKLTGELTIRKSCFVNGETVYGSIKVVNGHSSVPIEFLSCQLLEHCTPLGEEKCDAPEGTERLVMEKQLHQTLVSPNGSLHKTDVALITIPALPPSVIGGKPVKPNSRKKIPFNVNYQIKVTCGPQLDLVLPITILSSFPKASVSNGIGSNGIQTNGTEKNGLIETGLNDIVVDSVSMIENGFSDHIVGPQIIKGILQEIKGQPEPVIFTPKYPVFEPVSASEFFDEVKTNGLHKYRNNDIQVHNGFSVMI